MENIFICALEKGVETLETGISYNEMYIYLTEEKGHPIPDAFEKQIRAWFFSCFFNYSITESYDSDEIFSKRITGWIKSDLVKDEKMQLLPEEYFRYLEYIELKEARETSFLAQKNATKSMKLAKYALLISSVLATASIVVGVFQLFK